jgi:lipopolysaccharide transport system ATP-binding protein
LTSFKPLSSEPVISLAGVSKIYRRPFGGLSLRGLVARLVGDGHHDRVDEFKALDSVNLEIGRGQALGLIGANGAGKSTLLKLIGGVTEATTGRVTVNGRLAPLIEVGAGFHPDLTGRENVYLNAAMLGLNTAEIEARLDSIIEFADLGTYIDMPVRSYSSGMVVRLGFAVAIHVEPEILLIDEVLSVGDLEFRARSYERIQNERRRGTTIVLVSHSLPAITALCDRAIWLEHGCVRQYGPASDVVAAYQDDQEARIQHRIEHDIAANGSSGCDLSIGAVTLHDEIGQARTSFTCGGSLGVTLQYTAAKPLPHPYFVVFVEKDGAAVFAANMLIDGHQPQLIDGEGRLTCTFEALPLLPGRYQIGVQVRATPGHNYFEHRVMATFSVAGRLHDVGLTGDFADTIGRHAPPVLVPYRWSLQDGVAPQAGVGALAITAP